MKKIGFVDYYISEWHANNYPTWMKNACEKLGLDFEVAYAWAEIDKSPVDGVTTDEWCEKNGRTLDEVEQAAWDAGVALQDGRMFFGKCHLRINLALPHSRVQEAFRRLDRYVFNP